MRGRPNCQNCRHYYITWDSKFPYGCRAMGFKSRKNPGIEVRQAMEGQQCLMYSPKKACVRRRYRPAIVKYPGPGKSTL